MSSAIKHPVPDRVKPVICNFWHPGQKLQMTSLTRSGTVCFINSGAYGNSGRLKVNLVHRRLPEADGYTNSVPVIGTPTTVPNCRCSS